MIFLSILIALVLERTVPQLVDFRKFNWLNDYNRWMVDVLHVESMGTWLSLAVLLSPLIVISWIISAMFENALFGLFELAFNVAIIFVCIGPQLLDKQVDQYLDALEIGVNEQSNLKAEEITGNATGENLSTQVTQVCQSIFTEANTRIYAVLFWFTLLGPVAAILYRLLEQLLRRGYLPNSLSNLKQSIRYLVGWIDWLPAHLTYFAYMVTGSFEDGLQAFRQGSITAEDTYEQNQKTLQNVGSRSISLQPAADTEMAQSMVRKARGLVLRALVVWLVFVLLIRLID